MDASITHDGWLPHADGFVCGRVGVFPSRVGAWVVWELVGEEWRQVEPMLAAERSGRAYDKNKRPPWVFWEASHEDVVEAAKKLAIKYASTIEQ